MIKQDIINDLIKEKIIMCPTVANVVQKNFTNHKEAVDNKEQ